MSQLDFMWSNTDFPYMCLRDEVRTLAFRQAISAVVKQGDIVVDVGAGSGILSFFAAEAGARRVIAVEVEPMLADALRKSIRANNLQEVVEVVEGDIFEVNLPANVDVLIAEIMDTGLIDELQVPAINALRFKGIVGNRTKIIPCHYSTFLQLLHTDHTYYGYKVFAPKHEWTFYEVQDSGWTHMMFKPVSDLVRICSTDFSKGFVDVDIRTVATFVLKSRTPANAVRLTGLATLSNGIVLGPTNAFNGDKILTIEPVIGNRAVHCQISYRRGGGLHSLTLQQIYEK